MTQHRPLFATRNVLLFATLLTLFATACKKDHNTVVTSFTRVDSLSFHYLLGDGTFTLGTITTVPTLPIGAALTHFEFQGDKITGRVGGNMTLTTSDGPVSVFSNAIYDTVTYDGNTITITTKARENAGFSVPPNTRVITMINGSIQKQTSDADTTYYYYDGNNINRTENYSKNKQLTRRYTFSKNNLTTITTTSTERADNSISSTTTETLSGYDTKANGLKSYGIWNDIYVRSLSKNNFNKYESVTLQGGTPLSTSSSTFTIVYKSNGEVDYSK